MASIYERPILSPAQLTKRLIEQAKEAALIDEWAQYEEQNRLQREVVLKRRNLGSIDHGTRKGYQRGCKCDECKDAHNKWQREYRHRKGINKPRQSGRTFIHGTYYSYQYGKCRCELCDPVGKEHNKKYRERKKERESQAQSEVSSGLDSTNEIIEHPNVLPHEAWNSEETVSDSEGCQQDNCKV